MPGGTRSGGRVDRFYLTRDLTDAVPGLPGRTSGTAITRP